MWPWCENRGSRAMPYLALMGQVHLFKKRAHKAALLVAPFSLRPGFKCPVMFDCLNFVMRCIQALCLFTVTLVRAVYLCPCHSVCLCSSPSFSQRLCEFLMIYGENDLSSRISCNKHRRPGFVFPLCKNFAPALLQTLGKQR